MIITDIAELDKKRSRIYIDGEFAFILYKGEIREYHLKTGEEISSPVFQKIRTEVIPKRAKLRAMNLLQKKDYTEYKLITKLREGLYPEDIISDTIEYLKSFNYLNDERFAADYIRYHMNDRSRNRMKQDLMQKGIDKDLITRVMEEVYESETLSGIESPNPEVQLCIKLLNKKHYNPDSITYEDKQKLIGYLFRKGFSMDSIQMAFQSFGDNQ
jgi:regulatory protein